MDRFFGFDTRLHLTDMTLSYRVLSTYMYVLVLLSFALSCLVIFMRFFSVSYIHIDHHFDNTA